MRLALLLLLPALAAGQSPFELPKLKIPTAPNIGMLGMPKGARKINGRWWTRDNREITQQMGFWQARPAAAGLVFHHHHPFDIRKAEYTHLGMSKAQIQAALGEPNQTFDMSGGRSLWNYYSSDGTSTNVAYLEGAVADVAFLGGPGQKGRSLRDLRRPVSVQTELLTRLATQPSSTIRSRKGSSSRAEAVPVEPVAPTPKRIVSEEQISALSKGLSRQDVVEKLGEPSTKFTIAGIENAPETLTYHLESGKAVELKFEAGNLVDIRR
jgi:hypothetical protein